MIDIVHENKFHKEVECLMKAKHKNIVRFRGYCAEAHGKAAEYEGNFVMANILNWLLCFEYVPNGNLQKYITGWTGMHRFPSALETSLYFLLKIKNTNIIDLHYTIFIQNLASSCIDAYSGLEWRVRFRMIKGICEGLNYLHMNRMLHLDLKPANILLDSDMVPKISDFGLSRYLNEGKTHDTTKHLLGTP
jgi:serine/threonine protein kinase